MKYNIGRLNLMSRASIWLKTKTTLKTIFAQTGIADVTLARHKPV